MNATTQSYYQYYSPQVEIVSQPWASFVQSSGGYFSIPIEVSRISGLTSWLDSILFTSEENHCPLTTPEVPNALTAIRSAFSMNVIQLAEVMQVSRQAIYDWMDGKPVKVENRHRIASIRDFVQRWNDIHPKSMGRIVAEEIGGPSLLALLSADVFEESTITRQLQTIADRLAIAEANRPPSARELVEKYGMRPMSESDYRRNLQSASFSARRGS